MMIKRYFLSAVLILFSNILLSGAELKVVKTNPKNSIEMLQYLVKNVKLRKKYKVSDDIEKFNHILVGNWFCFEWGNISFFKNGRFKRVRTDYRPEEVKVVLKGEWRVEGNNLKIRYDFQKSKEWTLFEIDYYIFYGGEIKYRGLENDIYEKIRFKRKYKGKKLYRLTIDFTDKISRDYDLYQFELKFIVDTNK